MDTEMLGLLSSFYGDEAWGSWCVNVTNVLWKPGSVARRNMFG